MLIEAHNFCLLWVHCSAVTAVLHHPDLREDSPTAFSWRNLGQGACLRAMYTPSHWWRGSCSRQTSRATMQLHAARGCQHSAWAAGMNKVSEKQLWGAEKGIKKWELMIGAMTEEEREDPDLLASSTTRWMPLPGYAAPPCALQLTREGSRHVSDMVSHFSPVQGCGVAVSTELVWLVTFQLDACDLLSRPPTGCSVVNAGLRPAGAAQSWLIKR